MKFLCDVMLARVARWLRAAGYDTELADSKMEDQEILAKARQEKRYLITRDKHFLEMKDNECVIFLSGNTVSECIEELEHKLPIDWQKAPFTRCLICNHELVSCEPDERIPEDILSTQSQFWNCPACQKIYWEGSHTKRMRRWLINRAKG